MKLNSTEKNQVPIPLSKIKAIIFDMDGTLVDTERTASLVISESFQTWGLTLQKEDLNAIIGVTWRLAAQRLYAKYKIPVSPEAAFQVFKERYRKRLEIDGLLEVPGATAAVKDLAKHYPVALVSGSLRNEIQYVLKGLKIEEHFLFYYGAEDYPQSKPAPDGYLKAMETLGVEPEETLIFEDSWAGVQSGKAAGAWVIGITGAHHFEQDLSEAHFIMQDLRQVGRKWLQNS